MLHPVLLRPVDTPVPLGRPHTPVMAPLPQAEQARGRTAGLYHHTGAEQSSPQNFQAPNRKQAELKPHQVAQERFS